MGGRYVVDIDANELVIRDHGFTVAAWPLATPADVADAVRVLGFLVGESARVGTPEWGKACEDAACRAIAALPSLTPDEKVAG